MPRGDQRRAAQQSIGVGKGTVTLEDFDHADAVFCIGHNPGTNHPRMLTTLREASRRGVPIVVASIRCASAGWSASPRRRTRSRC